ncbi:MAG: imidazole glycerol phosphate synthase cyclase subunit [Candidatus Omnitrophota bacterium]
MLKKRLIVCLLLWQGHLVKTRNFANYQIIGNPITSIEQFNTWAVDEIILLDLSTDSVYDFARKDYRHENPDTLPGIITYLSKSCFVPLAVGGNIKSVEDIRLRLKRGADKVCINTAAVKTPQLIKEASKIFGSQCVVVSIDAKLNPSGKYEVFIEKGKVSAGLDPAEWAKQAQDLGAGEILLNSIDRNGTMSGYDIDLIRSVADNISIPLIACGGAGDWDDFSKCIIQGNASAAAAANIFHYREQSTRKAKKRMSEAGIDVRLDSFFIMQ